MFRLDQEESPTTQPVERNYVPALWRVTSKYRGFARRMNGHQLIGYGKETKSFIAETTDIECMVGHRFLA